MEKKIIRFEMDKNMLLAVVVAVVVVVLFICATLSQIFGRCP